MRKIIVVDALVLVLIGLYVAVAISQAHDRPNVGSAQAPIQPRHTAAH